MNSSKLSPLCTQARATRLKLVTFALIAARTIGKRGLVKAFNSPGHHLSAYFRSSSKARLATSKTFTLARVLVSTSTSSHRENLGQSKAPNEALQPHYSPHPKANFLSHKALTIPRKPSITKRSKMTFAQLITSAKEAILLMLCCGRLKEEAAPERPRMVSHVCSNSLSSHRSLSSPSQFALPTSLSPARTYCRDRFV